MGDSSASRGIEGDPDFFLGSSDTVPEYWGVPVRRCWVIDRPRFGRTGRALWRVHVDPPLPKYDETLTSIIEQISEWILAERYVGERLENLDAGHHMMVNIWRYNDPRAHEKSVFDSVDLTHEYIGEVALTADALPERWDPKKAWEQDFERIRRFVERHGHSRVPDHYHDESGMRLDTVVGDIRWYHAGRGGWSDGPYPGVDYIADLAKLEGWSWEVEDDSDLERLRKARFEAPLIRALGLREGIAEAEYIGAVTTALRESDKSPWPAVRRLIAEKGIDVECSAVVELIPIRLNRGYLGAVVVPGMRVFSFYFGIGGDPDEPGQWPESLMLSEWHKLTPQEARRRYGNKIDIAEQLLGDTGVSGG